MRDNMQAVPNHTLHDDQLDHDKIRDLVGPTMAEAEAAKPYDWKHERQKLKVQIQRDIDRDAAWR